MSVKCATRKTKTFGAGIITVKKEFFISFQMDRKLLLFVFDVWESHTLNVRANLRLTEFMLINRLRFGW